MSDQGQLAIIFFGTILVWFIVLLGAAAALLFGIDYIAGTTYLTVRNTLVLTGVLAVLSCFIPRG